MEIFFGLIVITSGLFQKRMGRRSRKNRALATAREEKRRKVEAANTLQLKENWQPMVVQEEEGMDDEQSQGSDDALPPEAGLEGEDVGVDEDWLWFFALGAVADLE